MLYWIKNILAVWFEQFTGKKTHTGQKWICWIFHASQWPQWLNFPCNPRVLNYDRFLRKYKFEYTNTTDKSRWICDISTPLWILPFLILKKSCLTEMIAAKWYFRILIFKNPNNIKTTLFLLHMAPWIFGVEDITLGDTGLKFFVLLSRNMPDYGTIVWFAGTCLENFSKGAVNLSQWADRQANGLFAHPRSNVISWLALFAL